MLIAAERGRLDPIAPQHETDDEVIASAAITASELLRGVHRLAGTVARTRAQRFVERILSLFRYGNSAARTVLHEKTRIFRNK